MDKFWICSVRGTFSKRFETKYSAVQRAEELARSNVGQDVYVLESIASCKTDLPPVNWDPEDFPTDSYIRSDK